MVTLMLASFELDWYLKLVAMALKDHVYVALLVVCVLQSMALFPLGAAATHYSRAAVAGIRGVVVGLVATVSGAIVFFAVDVFPNRYLRLGFVNVILEEVLAILKVYLLTAVLATALLIVYFVIAGRVVGDRSRLRIPAEILPLSLVIFAAGGYWLNRFLFPRSFHWITVLGNLGWLLASLGLAFVAGRLLHKMCREPTSLSPPSRRRVAIAMVLFLVGVMARDSYAYVRKGASHDRPNVILISIDTLRADHLSCYGYSRQTSPNIERLASDAVLFDTAIAQAPWTLPSHMSIFTALYASHHGVSTRGDRLARRFTTLTEILKNAGYRNAAFTGGAYVSESYGYQGFDLFRSRRESVAETFSKALSWLKANADKGPFFLFLHTYEVHVPYDPPSEYDRFSDRYYDGIVDVEGHMGKYYKDIRSEMTDEDLDYVIGKYDGEILFVDTVMGRLLDEIEARGLIESTIIVFTSDHGENFHHPGAPIGHHSFYEPVVRIPLLIRAPGLPRGVVVEQQVESIDIMPTILELVGLPAIPSDGVSLVDLIRTGNYDQGFAFSEQTREREGLPDYYDQMVRNETWKLISRRLDEEIEFFDLVTDPDERTNLFPESLELAEPLIRAGRRLRSSRLKESTPALKEDARLREELKALGYLQ